MEKESRDRNILETIETEIEIGAHVSHHHRARPAASSSLKLPLPRIIVREVASYFLSRMLTPCLEGRLSFATPLNAHYN